MPPPQGPDVPSDAHAPAPAAITDAAAELLTALLRLDPGEARRIRTALGSRRRPPGMSGPSLDLGADTDDAL